MNSTTDKDPKLLLSTPARILLLLCITCVCYLLMSVLAGVVTSWGEAVTTPKMRILAIVQDVMVFIVPAVVCALMVTRIPATLLCVDRKMRGTTFILAVLTMVAAAPAMNAIVAWNASIHLPESMATIETWLRESETGAAKSISYILGGTGIADLVMSLLIVGIAAGFSEELFFRGAFQRLLGTSGISPQLAVWIAAIIFSVCHFQFFGFVPRLLLGAFFGYLLLWTSCLWLPVLIHIFNNGIYIVHNWIAARNGVVAAASPEDGIPVSPTDWLIIALSVILTIVGLYLIRRSARH